MSDKVLIFGKDAWPYTRAARAAFAKDGRQVDYYNVVKEARHLETMLAYSDGTRKVPVIVEGEIVTIGFEGGTWGIWFIRLEADWNDEWRLSNDELLEWQRTIDEWLMGKLECGIRNAEFGIRKADEEFSMTE